MAQGLSQTDLGSKSGSTVSISSIAWATAVFSGDPIPDDSVLFFDKGVDDTQNASGAHDGTGNASALTDSSQAWATDEWVGYTVLNTTDVSEGSVTANTNDDVTATLSGANDADWDVGDLYLFEHATKLTDSTKSWATNEWAGFRLINELDLSSGEIASNTSTTITVTSLSGGTNNAFRVGDDYHIVLAVDSGDLIQYQTQTNLGGTVSMDTEGVPVVTGSSGNHTFLVRVLDASDSYSKSSNFLITMSVT